MDRREFLSRAVALGVVAATSGCTARRLEEAEREPPPFSDVSVEDLDLPVRQPLGVAAAGIERTAAADVSGPDDLATVLDEAGLEVEHFAEETEEGEPILSLEYAAGETSDDGLMAHLGLVAGGYAALVDADHESEKVVATIVDADGTEYGEYEVRRHWAEEYNADELTAREYAHEVAVTVESTTP